MKEKLFNIKLRQASRYLWHQVIYPMPPYPTKPIMVNPSDIKKYNLKFGTKNGLGQIAGGDWDLEGLSELAQHPTVIGLRQHFEDGMNWENTEYYQHAKVKMEEKGIWWGYNQMADFVNVRCAYVDDLYQSIKTNGYRPNEVGGHSAPKGDHRMGKKIYKHSLEPLVLIDRVGRFQLRDGIHRIALSLILGVREVPVQVLGRHRTWVRKRAELIRAKKSGGSGPVGVGELAHPDLGT